jgi:hypothetical protein
MLLGGPFEGTVQDQLAGCVVVRVEEGTDAHEQFVSIAKFIII